MAAGKAQRQAALEGAAKTISIDRARLAAGRPAIRIVTSEGPFLVREVGGPDWKVVQRDGVAYVIATCSLEWRR